MKRELNSVEEDILKKISWRMNICIPKIYPTVEYFYRGTYTGCILTVDAEIVGIGMTKKYKYDKENSNIAVEVSFAKAVRDYLTTTKVTRKIYKLEDN